MQKNSYREREKVLKKKAECTKYSKLLFIDTIQTEKEKASKQAPNNKVSDLNNVTVHLILMQ